MSKEQYSPIRFKLEESIWLDHHAQGAEIMSLELEPEIEVMEDEKYITITGHLVLRGRFEVSDEDGEGSLDLESSSLADQLHFQPLRVEQKEVHESEHRGKIEKRFPVDVTVPANKVEDIEDVYVKIDQFDYRITDGHLLQIESDIEITGILSEAKKVEKVDFEAEVEEQSGPNIAPSPLLPSFDVAASKDENAEYDPPRASEDLAQKEETHTVEAEADRQESEADTTVEEKREEVVAEVQEENQQEENEQVERFEEVTQEVESREESQEEESREEENQEEESREEENQEEDKVVPLFSQEIKTNFQSLPSMDEVASAEELSDDPEAAEEARAAAQKSVTTFLSQLMSTREDEEEEQFTRLKMCIIQRNESLESISERYEIPVRDIMRVNQLESEQITEGQILYIPKS